MLRSWTFKEKHCTVLRDHILYSSAQLAAGRKEEDMLGFLLSWDIWNHYFSSGTLWFNTQCKYQSISVNISLCHKKPYLCSFYSRCQGMPLNWSQTQFIDFRHHKKRPKVPTGFCHRLYKPDRRDLKDVSCKVMGGLALRVPGGLLDLLCYCLFFNSSLSVIDLITTTKHNNKVEDYNF